MELLDQWAIVIGQSTCGFLSGSEQDGLYQMLCYNGPASAGWRMIVMFLVLTGLGLIVWFNRERGRR